VNGSELYAGGMPRSERSWMPVEQYLLVCKVIGSGEHLVILSYGLLGPDIMAVGDIKPEEAGVVDVVEGERRVEAEVSRGQKARKQRV
jgi:hypothetical protein